MQIFEIKADVDDRNNFETLLRERERLALLSSEISKALIHKKSVEEILSACANAIVEHLDAAFAAYLDSQQREKYTGTSSKCRNLHSFGRQTFAYSGRQI